MTKQFGETKQALSGGPCGQLANILVLCGVVWFASHLMLRTASPDVKLPDVTRQHVVVASASHAAPASGDTHDGAKSHLNGARRAEIEKETDLLGKTEKVQKKENKRIQKYEGLLDKEEKVFAEEEKALNNSDLAEVLRLEKRFFKLEKKDTKAARKAHKKDDQARRLMVEEEGIAATWVGVQVGASSADVEKHTLVETRHAEAAALASNLSQRLGEDDKRQGAILQQESKLVEQAELLRLEREEVEGEMREFGRQLDKEDAGVKKWAKSLTELDELVKQEESIVAAEELKTQGKNDGIDKKENAKEAHTLPRKQRDIADKESKLQGEVKKQADLIHRLEAEVSNEEAWAADSVHDSKMVTDQQTLVDKHTRIVNSVAELEEQQGKVEERRSSLMRKQDASDASAKSHDSTRSH